MTVEQDRQISETVAREQPRLRNFIRRRVADEGDAEDILQDVFYELVEAYRLMKPIEQITGWLYRVARNRIIDRFRRKKPAASIEDAPREPVGEETFAFADLLPSPEAGPDATYARNLLLEELEAAIDELPDEQRDVFIAHEIDGESFKEIAAETGLSVNTLVLRKHYAVLHLRERLRTIHDEFTKG